MGLGAPIADAAHYERMLEAVGALMEDVAAVESGPLGGLAALLADRIREYEDRVHPWPDSSTPATVLAFLMAEHGLRQYELPEVGSQGVVSEVLSGRRALNLRQGRAAHTKGYLISNEVQPEPPWTSGTAPGAQIQGQNEVESLVYPYVVVSNNLPEILERHYLNFIANQERLIQIRLCP